MEVDYWRPHIDEIRQRGVKRGYSDDQSLHEFVIQALKDRQYIVAAYVINGRFDILNQSPMVYAMSLNDPTLLFTLLAFGNDVNGQYYKDIDADEHYSLLHLAYESGSEVLFNLLLLHPTLDINRAEFSTSDLSEISVFMGQGYQYDYFYPALILLDEKYQQIWPYLGIDVNHEYENEQTLFLIASEQSDYQRMTRLYQLGANIHPDSYDWGSPLYRGLSEYQCKGKSKLLDWYANIYEPLIYQDLDAGGGILGLLEGNVSNEIRKKFGLQHWPTMQSEFDELEIVKQKYRVFAPNLEPVFKVSKSLGALIHDMDNYCRVSGSESYLINNFVFNRPKPLQPVSILNDMERVYKVAFGRGFQNVEVVFSGLNMELILTNSSDVKEIFVIPNEISSILLGTDSENGFHDSEFANMTEFQLMYLLLNASLDDWMKVHHYLEEEFNVTLFCFDSRDEYKYCRGICGLTDNAIGKAKEDEVSLAFDMILP